jgi:hypothetical protein
MSAANHLTRQVIEFIENQGGTARRVNVTGIPDGKGGYKKGGMKRGFEDIDAVVPVTLSNGEKFGLKVAIEVKIGRDRQSPYQRARQREIEAAGGIYLIARRLENFIEDLKTSIHQKIQS